VDPAHTLLHLPQARRPGSTGALVIPRQSISRDPDPQWEGLPPVMRVKGFMITGMRAFMRQCGGATLRNSKDRNSQEGVPNVGCLRAVVGHSCLCSWQSHRHGR